MLPQILLTRATADPGTARAEAGEFTADTGPPG